MVKPGLTAAACLFGAAAATASHAQDVLGAPYATARETLIGMGAEPRPAVRTETSAAACRHPDGDWCERWPELIDCAGSGAGACVFLWRAADGAVITIVTAGETNPRVTAIIPAG